MVRVPQRNFEFSYLIHPQDYEKEVLGVQLPLSFSLVDKEGYVLNYIPVSLYDSHKMTTIFLAEREQLIHEIEKSFVSLAEHNTQKSFDVLETNPQGEKSYKQTSEMHYLKTSVKDNVTADYHTLSLADNLEIEGDVYTLFSADNLEVYGQVHRLASAENGNVYGQVHRLTSAEEQNEYREVLLNNVLVSFERYNQYKEMMAHELLISDTHTYRDTVMNRLSVAENLDVEAMFLAAFTAHRENLHQEALLVLQDFRQAEIEARSGKVHKGVTGQRVNNLIGMVSFLIRAENEGRGARLTRRMSLAEEEGRGARLLKRLPLALHDGRSAHILKRMQQAAKESHGGKILTKVIRAIKESHGAHLLKRIAWALKDSDGGSVLKRVTLAIKDNPAAYYKQDFKLMEKETYNSFRMARTILGVIKEKEGQVSTGFAADAKKEKEGWLEHPTLLAEYGSPEAVIQKALTLMEKSKSGIGEKFVLSVIADSKQEQVSDILSGLEAETKQAHDSLLEELQLADTKNAWDSVLLKLKGFLKNEHPSGWIERVVLATLSDVRRQALVDRLLEFGDDIGKDTFIAVLEEAEVPDPEALVHELELGWNKDKPNRPAGMMSDFKGGWWDIGFDDLMETWKEGWDYLDPPSKDYNYEKHKPDVYDANGVPLDPLGPTNLADVDVKTAINHPHPEWAGVGSKEAWVELYTYQDILINIATIWKRETNRIAGMTGHQALQEILKQLHEFLQESTPWDKQYQRMFRFVRWYAEMISHKDSITVLHRTYDDWKDKILSNGGFTHPHTIDQMIIQSTGVIESTSTTGFLEFEVENYIDGKITFSSSITSSNATSTSTIEFYIDDVLTHTFTVPDGVQRMSFDVPMGNHKYKWLYQTEVGDMVKLSGFNVSGVHFVEAYTTQKDAGTTRGMKAVDNLIQALLTYYHKHHKDKSKGAMGVRQRKIWLS